MKRLSLRITLSFVATCLVVAVPIHAAPDSINVYANRSDSGSVTTVDSLENVDVKPIQPPSRAFTRRPGEERPDTIDATEYNLDEGQSAVNKAFASGSVGVGAIRSFPQGALRENLAPAFGGELVLAMAFWRPPIKIGFNLSINDYGSKEFSDQLIGGLPNLTEDIEIKNSMFAFHMLVRVGPSGGSIRPYLDGLFGFKDFSTFTTISIGETDLVSDHESDVVPSYGFAAGLMILVYDWGHAGSSLVTELLVELRGSYLRSPRTRYATMNSIGRENGELFVEFMETDADLSVAYVGITVGGRNPPREHN